MPVPAGSGSTPAPTSGPLVYDPVLSRVRLTVPGLMAGYPVRVERSTDGARWTVVRGGQALLPSAGAARLDDYEFTSDVINHYRVAGPAVWDRFDRTLSGQWGDTESGQTWTLSHPSDSSVSGGMGRHTLSVVNSVRESRLPVSFADVDVTVHGVGVSAAATGAPIDQAIVGRYVDGSNYVDMRVFRTPAGAPTMALRQVSAGVETVVGFPSIVGATAGTLISLRLQAVGSALRGKAWVTGQPEPDAWLASMTATHLSAGAVEIRSLRETGNTNAGVVASYDSVVVTTPEAVLFAGFITPSLGAVWLKSLARPYLNRQVTVRDFSEVTRRARGGVFDVVGRSVPVAVTDVRGSRQWSLDVSTYSARERSDLDMLLVSGDILLVHVPPAAGRISATPGGYVTVGDTREVTPPTSDLAMRVFTLPCVEAAAPGPDVLGATITCQGVLDMYATCAAVLAAHSTCLSLLELIGDPTDVIVS